MKNKRFRTICKDLETLGWDFRINDLDESIEVKIGEMAWTRMTDILEAVLETKLWALDYGTRSKPSMGKVRKAVMRLAHEQRFNAIKNYFNGLDNQYMPNSDGSPYLINNFCHHNFENPDAMFSTWLFRWMTGAIAKLYERARNPMLVIDGPQEIGKSSFVRWLCPLDAHFLDESINPDSKDSEMRLTDTFIWEISELGATTRRSDVEALKSFLTRPLVKKRPAYARYTIQKPTTCSFVGTVNYDGAGFLNDPTGNTRFLSCEITSIDFGYTTYNRDLLWSEAVWFYRNRHRAWELTDEEKSRRTEINAQYEMVSALGDVIDHRLEITHNPEDVLPSFEIKNHLQNHYRITSENGFYNELGRALRKHGLGKKRANYQPGKPHVWCWVGIKKREV